MTRVAPATFFESRAERYDAAYDAVGANGHALRSRLEATLRLLGDGPGEVLDAGMGGGRLAAALARAGWTVTGIDAAGEMVALARRRIPDAEGRLVQAEIERLPFADAAFDAVVATGVLEYADVACALDELARVLRPGGRAVVSYPNPHCLYGIWKTRAFLPVVNAVKRVAGAPPEAAVGGSGRIGPREFAELLARRGLVPDGTEYVSFHVLLSPLEQLLPGLAERLGRLVEGRGGRLGSRLAGQILYSARRLTPDASTASAEGP